MAWGWDEPPPPKADWDWSNAGRYFFWGLCGWLIMYSEGELERMGYGREQKDEKTQNCVGSS